MTAKDQAQYVKVKLVFCRGVNPEKKKAGKHDWALFLSTDTSLNDEKILEIYALRWGIEVYFKEAKQHLGFFNVVQFFIHHLNLLCLRTFTLRQELTYHYLLFSLFLVYLMTH